MPGCWNAYSHYFNQHGTGCYRRTFELAEAAADAFLVVDGVGLRSRFWVDGREIGFSKLPWSRFEFRTGSLAAGRHELVAAVDSVVDNKKVKLFWDFYDFYPYGGFHHGVKLDVQVKPVELRRVVVRTRDYKTGRVELEAQFVGKDAPRDFTASVAFDGGEPREVAFTNRRATLNVRTAVAVDRPAEVYHIPYMTLFVDRASNGHKTQALLPGIEYLADEPSSNEKELRGPQANRLIPAAHKFCYPLMAIADASSWFAFEWTHPTGVEWPFAPVFDTPDRQFKSGGHLFALWAPGVGAARRAVHFD